MKLTAHLQLVSRLRMTGAIFSSSICPHDLHRYDSTFSLVLHSFWAVHFDTYDFVRVRRNLFKVTMTSRNLNLHEVKIVK